MRIEKCLLSFLLAIFKGKAKQQDMGSNKDKHRNQERNHEHAVPVLSVFGSSSWQRQCTMHLDLPNGIVQANNQCDQEQTSVDRIPGNRSEENTSELQSLMRISYAVFCLKKTKIK